MLINLYRPPQGNTKDFSNILHDTVTSVNALHNNEIEIFIMGDFNVNYSNPLSPGYQDLKWFEQRTGLSQYITTTTRFSQTNSCIDLFFTNCNCITKSGVLDVNISDHQAIFITPKHIPKRKKAAQFFGRSYLNFDGEIFYENILNYNWNHLYTLIDIDEAWEYFISHIMSTIDAMCPLRTFDIKNMKDPWISNKILESIHDKDLLIKRAKRTDNVDDWKIARNARYKQVLGRCQDNSTKMDREGRRSSLGLCEEDETDSCLKLFRIL